MDINNLTLRAVLEPLLLHFECLPTLTILPRSCTMPQIPTVYLLLNEEKVVYVGQSKNLRLRMAQHANSPKKARLGYDRIAFATPQIVSPHNRLVLESVVTAITIPPGNQVVALRRTKYGCWIEITSLRWSSWKGKERGDE